MPAGKGSDTVPTNQTTLELRGDREIVIARAFNGPARIVFEAWTRPDLVQRWWAPKSRTVGIVVADADVRVGGTYRYVFKLPKGNQFAFSGTYQEVAAPSRLVYTQFFEPTASGVTPGDLPVVVTITFDERNGKTYMTSVSTCPSQDVRDAIIATGMEGGMRETMDQLEELIASLQ
jgi:uncharacterized protein YndB with AHSA1/START domain